MRRAALLGSLLFGLLIGLAAPALAQGPSVVVVVDGVQRRVPLVERQGRRFVELEEIALLIGGQVAEPSAEEAVLAVDDQRLVVHRRVPFVEFGGRWYQMTEGAQRDADGFFLPASTLDLLLPALWPGRFRGTVPGAVPSGRDEPPPVETPPRDRSRSGMIGRAEAADGVDFWIGPGRTRLSFRTPRTPGVEVDATEPRTLRMRFSGVELAPALGHGLTRLGLVDSARVAPHRGATDVTLWLDRAATVFAVSPLRADASAGRAGVEVVLIEAATDEAAAILGGDVALSRPATWDSRGRGSDRDREEVVDEDGRGSEQGPQPRRREPPAPRLEPPPEPASEAGPRPRRSGGNWVVVVDAGHGGHDPGSMGPDGTREKDVTLSLAHAVRRALLTRDGVEVILTRGDDTFIPLGGRTRLANEAHADIFLSIHTNAAERSSAEGFETYFLSAAVTEDARRVAQMENSAIRYENTAIDPSSLDDVNFILWDLAQNEYLRESSILAETIQVELGQRVPLKSRGVKQAPFYVLKGAFMPAILFESAFISNPREEELLNDAAFRNRLAEGLASSVVAYLDRYGRKVGTATAAR